MESGRMAIRDYTLIGPMLISGPVFGAFASRNILSPTLNKWLAFSRDCTHCALLTPAAQGRMLRNRPIPEDPNIRPVIRDPYEQVIYAHYLRVGMYVGLQLFIGNTPFLLASLVYRTRLTGLSFVLACLGYQLSQLVVMYGRYQCTFGASNLARATVTLVLMSLVSNVLLCGVFMFMTPSGDLNSPNYRGMLFTTAMVSAVWQCYEFVKRGLASSAGTGIWRKPEAHGYTRGAVKHLSPLERGYDQAMPHVDVFIQPKPRQVGPLGPNIPAYAQWLFPPIEFQWEAWAWVPPFMRGTVRWVVKNMLYRSWVLVQRAEVGQCVAWGWFTWLGAAVALYMLEGGLNRLMALLGMNFINADSGYFNTGSAWDTWRSVGLAARAFNLAWLSYFGTNLDTLIMYHILLQPINFSQFNVLRGLVWKPWLEKGYELAVTPVPDARKQDSLVTKEEPAWVTELEEHAQVHFRLAALADMTAFPPQVDLYRRISVTDRMYRALAFQDLTIAAVSQLSRRKIIYYDRRQWGSVGIPMITVINGMALQLELQVEAQARVEGGPASPLQNIHTRVGVSEVREGSSLARLIIESEVMKRYEDILLERERNGEPIRELLKVPLLPKTCKNVFGLNLAPTLQQLRIPTIEIQLVECAVRALGYFFEKSIEIDKNSKQFEDMRASSRPTVPSAVVALLNLQLSIHAYSAAATGNTSSVIHSTMRLHDRPGTVLAPFLRLSLAIDKTIEKIIYCFYETEFESWSFAPIYSKCLQVYVRSMLREPEPQDSPGALYLGN